MTPVAINVSPSEKADEFSWVFTNLEQIFPVSFRKIHASSLAESGIVFQASTDFSGPYPSRCLVFVQSLGSSSPASQQIHFHDTQLADERIRGRTLVEKYLSAIAPLGVSGETIASVNGNPVWVHKFESSQLDIVSLPSTVAPEKRMLADNFQQHHFFFLLSIIHFVYRVLKGSGWIPPPLRGSFIIDDPNLRHETYGFFDARKIVALAREHNFHFSVATPPVDLNIASDRVVSFFRENHQLISLCIHGNDHLHRELLRGYSKDEAHALLREMLGRVSGFEHRTGLKVAPVVVFPNEMCSREMLAAMQHFDIDAVTASRPKPWLHTDSWTEFLEENDSLLCSFPAEFVEGFMPLIRRTQILDNIVFRAFMNQPLVFYFHHTDFSDGFEKIISGARLINSLGSVQWSSIGGIATSNYEMRMSEEDLAVRPFSRNVSVTLPPGVTRVKVSLPATIKAGGFVCNVNGKKMPVNHDWFSPAAVEVKNGAPVEIRLLSASPHVCRDQIENKQKLMVWIRRRSAELRDRAMPYFKLSGGKSS